MNPFIENNERCHFPNFQEVFKVVEKAKVDKIDQSSAENSFESDNEKSLNWSIEQISVLFPANINSNEIESQGEETPQTKQRRMKQELFDEEEAEKFFDQYNESFTSPGTSSPIPKDENNFSSLTKQYLTSKFPKCSSFNFFGAFSPENHTSRNQKSRIFEGFHEEYLNLKSSLFKTELPSFHNKNNKGVGESELEVDVDHKVKKQKQKKKQKKKQKQNETVNEEDKENQNRNRSSKKRTSETEIEDETKAFKKFREGEETPDRSMDMSFKFDHILDSGSKEKHFLPVFSTPQKDGKEIVFSSPLESLTFNSISRLALSPILPKESFH